MERGEPLQVNYRIPNNASIIVTARNGSGRCIPSPIPTSRTRNDILIGKGKCSPQAHSGASKSTPSVELVDIDLLQS